MPAGKRNQGFEGKTGGDRGTVRDKLGDGVGEREQLGCGQSVIISLIEKCLEFIWVGLSKLIQLIELIGFDPALS